MDDSIVILILTWCKRITRLHFSGRYFPQRKYPKRSEFIKMNYQKDQFSCPVEATLFLIGGKYKPLILWHLIEKPLHYMELQRLIPKATPKMLSQQLRDLEECGMIHREVIPEKPPKTLYSLTAFGKSIIPVLDSMCNWGIHFLEGLDITPPCGSKL